MTNSYSTLTKTKLLNSFIKIIKMNMLAVYL